MPPGGPYWTQDQLALFAQWQKDGYNRKRCHEMMLVECGVDEDDIRIDEFAGY